MRARPGDSAKTDDDQQRAGPDHQLELGRMIEVRIIGAFPAPAVAPGEHHHSTSTGIMISSISPVAIRIRLRCWMAMSPVGLRTTMLQPARAASSETAIRRGRCLQTKLEQARM